MRKILGIIFTLLIAFACAEQEREITIVSQEESIDSYIESLSDDLEIVSENGTHRVVIENGEGEAATIGDSVYFYYAAYTFSSGKGDLYATNSSEVAEEEGFPLAGDIEGKVVGSGDLIYGLSYGLIGVKQGEQCNIFFSAKYGYYNEVVYNVPELSPLFFDIWIERVVKN